MPKHLEGADTGYVTSVRRTASQYTRSVYPAEGGIAEFYEAIRDSMRY